MSIVNKKIKAVNKIELLIEEQRTFWNTLHDLVELSGDQVVATRLRFLENKNSGVADGGSMLLSVIMVFGFSVFPVHTMIAGIITKGLSKSKTIQILADKYLVNKISKFSAKKLAAIDQDKLAEFEINSIKKLTGNDPIGQTLKLFITEGIKNRINSKKVNKDKADKNNQNSGIVIIKKGLYDWIAAHSKSDIQELLKIKMTVQNEELDENTLNEFLNDAMVFETTTKLASRYLPADDFQLLIEASIWSSTYDFFPILKPRQKNNFRDLLRKPIELSNNDEFWGYLLQRFLSNNFMTRVYHGKKLKNLAGMKRFANLVKYKTEDIKNMREKYSGRLSTNLVRGYNSASQVVNTTILIRDEDEEKLLLTFYFEQLSTILDNMQEEIIKKLDKEKF